MKTLLQLKHIVHHHQIGAMSCSEFPGEKNGENMLKPVWGLFKVFVERAVIKKAETHGQQSMMNTEECLQISRL